MDFVVDFNGKLFVFGEVKMEGVEMPVGQRMLHQNLVQAINKSGIAHACSLVCVHNTPIQQQIDASSTVVSEFLYWGTDKWMHPQKKTTAKDAVDALILSHGKCFHVPL